jgi:hypothetical protein
MLNKPKQVGHICHWLDGPSCLISQCWSGKSSNNLESESRLIFLYELSSMSILHICNIGYSHLTDIYLPQSCKVAFKRNSYITCLKSHNCPVGLDLIPCHQIPACLKSPPLSDVSISIALDFGYNSIFLWKDVSSFSWNVLLPFNWKNKLRRLKESSRVFDG